MPKEVDVKYGRKFGVGTFLGDHGDRYLDIPDIRDRAHQMAWSHACPVSDQVMKDYGPEWTEKRYAECNFTFGYLIDVASKHNFPLYFNLLQPTERLPGENPDLGISKDNVPQSFWSEMSPLSTPWGYAIPRILIEQFGRGENNQDRTQARVIRGLNLVNREIVKTDNPIDLLIALGKNIIEMDANPEDTIAHIMAKGILNEQGCKTMFQEISQKMKKKAPKMWNKYQEMLKDDKWQGVIVTPKDLK